MLEIHFALDDVVAVPARLGASSVHAAGASKCDAVLAEEGRQPVHEVQRIANAYKLNDVVEAPSNFRRRSRLQGCELGERVEVCNGCENQGFGVSSASTREHSNAGEVQAHIVANPELGRFEVYSISNLTRLNLPDETSESALADVYLV